ncbi:MAG: ribulose-phosphate 3-epimerase [Ignavibacteria bacterium]|nr:ribulose-phosphate 3-epimerase [Ignavibacteria bacterium]
MILAPSLLAADFGHLSSQIAECEAAGADILHIDVMDGHFVPPISFGVSLMPAIRAATTLPLDVHLMVTNPDHHIPQFADAGANWISVHAEVCPHLHRTLQSIRQRGCRAGIVLNPATPLTYATEAAEHADFILLMSVNPGYGGQAFIPSFFERCSSLRESLNEKGLSHIQIEVDGGVNASNIKAVCDAGAEIIVSGSGVFKGDIAQNILQIRANV